MKKPKAKDVDLLYLLEDDNKVKKSANKKKNKSNKADKSKKNKSQTNSSKKELFDFDDEIVIGITKKEDKPEDKKTKAKTKSKKNRKEAKQNKKTKQTKQTKQKDIYEDVQEEVKEKRKSKLRIFKYVFLLVVIFGGIIALLLSPVFNVKTITVTGNIKITSEQIISLSGLSTGINSFKMSMNQAEKGIKENPYIESVKVNRKLPGEITIEVTERVATYMIEFVNSVVYINNQGYMLEIATERLPIPVLSGVNTPVEEFKEGNRLNVEDLQKLETAIKIMDTLTSYDLAGLVTGINIADKNNYTVYMDGEGKIVYLGNATNLNDRIKYLKEILAREQGIQSEIFINKDVNKDSVYTRERV